MGIPVKNAADMAVTINQVEERQFWPHTGAVDELSIVCIKREFQVQVGERILEYGP